MGARRVIVVGAGIGGLAAAIDLARRGVSVTVLEAGATGGGKMTAASIEGRPVDCGPTVFTMRDVFAQLFADAGDDLDTRLAISPLDVLARHIWDPGAARPGAILDLHADREHTIDAIGTFAGAKAAAGYRAFAGRAAEIHATLDRSFMRDQRPSLPALVARVGVGNLAALMRIQPFTSLWRELGGYFDDPRLQQLFGRYATYCGSSPFAAPATLMLVAHVESCGVYSVGGGMAALAGALVSLAERCGARFRFGCHVSRIETRNGRACAVVTASGERIEADAVVFNGDVAALAKGLLGADVDRSVTVAPDAARSLSALTVATVADLGSFDFARHTVFFSRDYRDEFERIFKAGRLPAAPTVYACAADRQEGATHPAAGTRERLFLIANAPACRDGGRDLTRTEISACSQAIHDLLTRCGAPLSQVSQQTVTTAPADFAARYPGSGGALYGMASHGWLASFQRMGARTRIPNLYLAGGSVHPGPGAPMAALSGRLAATRLMSDLASMSPYHRVAMPGGTATR